MAGGGPDSSAWPPNYTDLFPGAHAVEDRGRRNRGHDANPKLRDAKLGEAAFCVIDANHLSVRN